MQRVLRRGLSVLLVSCSVAFNPVVGSGAVVSACVGDCNGDGYVTVDELVLGASIVLGNAPLTECPSVNANGGTAVTIDEVLAATNAAANGCNSSGTLAVSDTALCFTGFVGTELPSQTVTVRRAMGHWTATPSVPWLAVAPTEGQAPGDVQVTVQLAGLPDGSNGGEIQIADESGSTLTVQVDLNLYVPGNSAGWKVQTVEPVGTVGQITDIALDPAGRPAICSYRADPVVDRQLRYIRWTGCGWQAESVEQHGFDCSLAFDRGGQPHISFLGADRGILRYASKVATTWNIITIEEQGNRGDTGDRSSLAFDAGDLPHISYQLKFIAGVFTYDLRYASFDGTAWTLQTVDAAKVTGWDTSLALNAAGQPRISYHTDPATLKYAEWLGDHWNLEDVDFGGRPSSIRLDSSGRPLIAHHDPGPQDHPVKFAYRDDSGTWHVETVDHQGARPNGGARAFVSLALDSSGVAHIAYVDFETNTLKYATRLANGGGWHIEVIDAGPDVGDFCSLQIDSHDVAHISYLDLTAGTLKYARGPGSG